MHDEHRFYTRCLNICFTIFINLFLLIRDDFYKYHNVDFIHIYQHFLRFNAILKCYIRSIYAFERLTFTTQKQILSKHCFNQSIDIIEISVSILWVSTSLKHFLHDWYKFSFLFNVLCKRTGIAMLVNL